MEQSNQHLIDIIENLPIRLDRFWRARILRQHGSEDDFYRNLKICLAETNGESSLEIMTLLKERNLLGCYIAAQ